MDANGTAFDVGPRRVLRSDDRPAVRSELEFPTTIIVVRAEIPRLDTLAIRLEEMCCTTL